MKVRAAKESSPYANVSKLPFMFPRGYSNYFSFGITIATSVPARYVLFISNPYCSP